MSLSFYSLFLFSCKSLPLWSLFVFFFVFLLNPRAIVDSISYVSTSHACYFFYQMLHFVYLCSVGLSLFLMQVTFFFSDEAFYCHLIYLMLLFAFFNFSISLTSTWLKYILPLKSVIIWMASEYLMTQIYLLNYILLGLGFFKLFTPKFILYYLAIIFKTPCREKNLH